MEAGRRSELFREVNDRIYELLVSTDPDLPGAVRSNDCGRGGLLRRRRREPASGTVPVLT